MSQDKPGSGASSHAAKPRPRRDLATAKKIRSFRCAKRNVLTFRIAWRKSLKSLWTLNHSFRGIVCFQGLDPFFVSPFSRHGVSLWNLYRCEIDHFSGFFIFNCLAPLCFRRFRKPRVGPPANRSRVRPLALRAAFRAPPRPMRQSTRYFPKREAAHDFLLI